jgi:hypothetical protein
LYNESYDEHIWVDLAVVFSNRSGRNVLQSLELSKVFRTHGYGRNVQQSQI